MTLLSLANLPICGNEQLLFSNVRTVFDGDEPCSATAYALTPNGTEYAVCTTIQYGFKPASNNTWLTVEPQSTQVMTTTKTPEQLQAEAESSGWLRIEPEFSWWYPWYRLHLVLDVNLPQGHLSMDYGWTFLPFGQCLEMNEVAAEVFNDMAANIARELITSYFIGKLAQHVASLLLGKTLAGTVVAIAGYAFYSGISTLLIYKQSGDNPFAWLVGFISSAVGGTFGAFRDGLEKLKGFLTAASRRLQREISHIMNSCWARGLNFFDITGIAFALIDFAFMVFDLIQFLNLAT